MHDLLKFTNESGEKPLVLVFTATWLSQSSIVKIVVQKILNSTSKINLMNLDADTHKEIFLRYNVTTLPTVLLIKNKQIVHKIEGTFSKKMVLDILV